MNKGWMAIIGIVFFLFLLNLFIQNDYEIKSINESYQFFYSNEFQMCYVQKKGEEKSGGVFNGTVEYFGIKNNKMYCLVKKSFSIDVSGWYIIDFNNGNIEYLQAEDVNKNTISELYKIKLIYIHDHYGYQLDPTR